MKRTVVILCMALALAAPAAYAQNAQTGGMAHGIAAGVKKRYEAHGYTCVPVQPTAERNASSNPSG